MGPIQSQLNQASAPHTLDTSLAPLAWHPSRPCSQEFRAATTAQTREKSKQEKNVAMEHILSLVIWGAKVSVGKFEKKTRMDLDLFHRSMARFLCQKNQPGQVQWPNFWIFSWSCAAFAGTFSPCSIWAKLKVSWEGWRFSRNRKVEYTKKNKVKRSCFCFFYLLTVLFYSRQHIEIK